MAYSKTLMDHYENPRNVGSFNKDEEHIGIGMVGAPACGDVLYLQIKVNPQTQVIEDVKFKTFGCMSAIASSSLTTELVKGKTLEEALQIKNTYIAKELSLPVLKLHCSVLAETAIKMAIEDYLAKLHGKQLKQNLVKTLKCNFGFQITKEAARLILEQKETYSALRICLKHNNSTTNKEADYSFEYVNSKQPGDEEINEKDVLIFIEKKTLPYVMGMKLDIASSTISEFILQSQDNAPKPCTCGMSTNGLCTQFKI